MTIQQDDRGNEGGAGRNQAGQPDRKRREAAALKANLARRKQQQRGRKAAATRSGASTGTDAPSGSGGSK